MEHKIPLLLTVCQGIILSLIIGVSSDPEVQMESTTIRGKEVMFEGKPVNEYRGLPYAEPPVGELRFRKTKPLGTFPKEFDAFKQAPACRQYTQTPFPWYLNDSKTSEDCLYLNVWTPANGNDLKPVLVYIHSGNWKFGSNSIDHHSGVALAATNDIVVVTFTYRLGVFGFLSSDTEDAPGNAGLWDMKELLEWVQKYIKYFNGDPSQVTLAGQSSSAVAVGYFTLSDKTQSLYSKIIMQSGSPVNFQTDYNKQNIELGKKFAILVGCKEADWETFGPLTIQCLKDKPEKDMEMGEHNLGPNSTVGFHPITGDEFLPDNPRKSVLKGNFHCKPLLIGNNRDEGSIILSLLGFNSYGFFGEKDYKVDEVTVKNTLSIFLNLFPATKILAEFFKIPGVSPPPAMAAITDNPLLGNIPAPKSAVTVPVPLDKLPDNMANIMSPLLNNIIGDSSTDANYMKHKLYSAVGDMMTLCPTKYFAEKCAEQGNDVYYYFFVHRSSVSKFAPWMGVTHYSEIPFVFGMPLLNSGDYTDKDKDLSRNMVQYWGQFVKSGKPDPSWPKYTKEDPIYFVIGGKNGTKPIGKGPHQTNCELLRPTYEI